MPDPRIPANLAEIARLAATRLRDDFDLTIGRLDRLLSEFLLLAESQLDEADRQTIKHHAEDLISVGSAALKRLTRERT